MGKSLNTTFFLVVAAAISLLHNHSIDAINYTVTNEVANTTGGKLFDQEIGAEFAKQVMENATSFVWQVLNQTEDDERYVPEVVSLYISDFAGYAVERGDTINISGPYLGTAYGPPNRSKFLFTSVMYHEMTHVFQWKANYGAPVGLIEGIADYVMVKSNIYEKDSYKKPGSGSKWDEGYDVTERFLEYCDNLTEGFTAKLNKMMRYKYNDSYFELLLGKPVGQLWAEYKAMHGNLNDTTSDQASNTRVIAELNY
ncbi:basic secretory protease [Phtheirospermum japonicum]|uniref:Basic secretory protease n=1 Tax=Phtheirospermum japonicum TaxID=374723 RepID=A0A830CZE7_9LAMI|nr:basic secretory protease [Phtheirospermum japonicum]